MAEDVVSRVKRTMRALARAVASQVNKPLATRRLRQYRRAHQPPYRVQVGSGLVQRPGWLNTDIGPAARFWLDIGAPLPFPDHSVEYLFSEHVIEHVDPAVVARFLREAYRVLAPGGVIRTLTPDPEGLAREYLARSDLARAVVQRGAAAGYRSRYPVDLLNVVFYENGHCYLWDEESLTAALREAGFQRITRQQYGVSPHPELAAMDGHLKPDDPAIPFVLVLEATR